MLNITSNDSCEDVANPELEHLRRSYANEHRFYLSKFSTKLRRQAKLSLPRMVASDFDGSNPLRPWVCLVLNDVTRPQQTLNGKYGGIVFPEHRPFLLLEQARNAVQFAAHWHASRWGDRDESPATQLWPKGSYWRAKQCCLKANRIASSWTGTLSYLKRHHPQFITEQTKTLGSRLGELAGSLSEFWDDPIWALPYTTLIHGDFKAANLFFRSAPDDPTKNGIDHEILQLCFSK